MVSLAHELTELWKPNGAGGFVMADNLAYGVPMMLHDAIEGSVTIPINGQRTNTVKLSVAHPYAWAMKYPFQIMLRTWLLYGPSEQERVCVAWGIITSATIDPDEQTVTLNAVCPTVRAAAHYLRRGDRALNPPTHPDLPNPYNRAVPINGAGYRMLLDAAQNLPGDQENTYPPLGIAYGRRTTLNGAIDDNDTTVTLNDLAGFTADAVWLQIGDEWMRGTPAGLTVSSITRGAAGTTPAAHADDAAVLVCDDDSPNLATSTKLKTSFIRSDEVWGKIEDLSKHQTAPDFELVPVTDEPGVYTRLHVYERQGEYDGERDRVIDPRPVVFEDKFGKGNARVTHRPGGRIVTHAHILSERGGKRITRASTSAAETYGPWVIWEPTDYKASDTAILALRGDQLLDAYNRPQDFVEVVPHPDAEYRYLRDFIIGSVINVDYSTPQDWWKGQARVIEVGFTQAPGEDAQVKLAVVPHEEGSFSDNEGTAG